MGRTGLPDVCGCSVSWIMTVDVSSAWDVQCLPTWVPQDFIFNCRALVLVTKINSEMCIISSTLNFGIFLFIKSEFEAFVLTLFEHTEGQ